MSESNIEPDAAPYLETTTTDVRSVRVYNTGEPDELHIYDHRDTTDHGAWIEARGDSFVSLENAE